MAFVAGERLRFRVECGAILCGLKLGADEVDAARAEFDCVQRFGVIELCSRTRLRKQCDRALGMQATLSVRR